MATWNDVRRIARTLPEVTEETSFGNAAWKVKKKLFAWERPLRKSDLNVLGDAAPAGAILGLRTDGLEMKEALLSHDRGVFFTTPHFDGYPAVLVQLDRISTTELKDAMIDAWLVSAPERLAGEFLAMRKRRR
jgi:hypothetical protein